MTTPKQTIRKTVSEFEAIRLVTSLMAASIWFEVCPLPDNKYDVITRDEPRLRKLFGEFVAQEGGDHQ